MHVRSKSKLHEFLQENLTGCVPARSSRTEKLKMSHGGQRGSGEEEESDVFDEVAAYKALKKLKCMPVPFFIRRIKKARLGEIPQQRLGFFARIWWEMKKLKRYTVSHFVRDFSGYHLFEDHLRRIQVECGIAIVNVFLFIRWTLLLNLLISSISLALVIIPFFAKNWDVVSGTANITKNCPIRIKGDPTKPQTDRPFPANMTFLDTMTLLDCCALGNRYETFHNVRGTTSVLSLSFTKTAGTRGFTVENTPFFYGYFTQEYHGESSIGKDYFPFQYICLILIVLLLSLVLMVRGVAKGVKDVIFANEGEHNPYTHLIFSGWDHFTKGKTSASFKRKVLRHEMKIALLSEKKTLESVLRTRHEIIKLKFLRTIVWIIWLVLLSAVGYMIFVVSAISIEERRSKRSGERLLPEDRKKLSHWDPQDIMENVLLGFAPSVLISVLNVIFPLILIRLGKLEKYSHQVTTGLVLIRALFVRLFSVGFAAYSLYTVKYCHLKDKITCALCKDPNFEDGLGFRDSCWESIFADQVYKLILVDMMIKIVLTMIVEPFRVKLKKWFKPKLIQRIGTLKFSIVRHSLDIIYIEVLAWIGMYFGPFIPILCVFYCLVVFYVKKFSLLHNCNTVPDTFKTTKTTTMFFFAKLIAFLVVCLTNVAVLGYMNPSRGCGPFRSYDVPWQVVKLMFEQTTFGKRFYAGLVTLLSIYPPLVMILILFAYYYYSVAQANRGMVDTLRHLLILEGHDKQYLFARLNALRKGVEMQKKGPRSTLTSRLQRKKHSDDDDRERQSKKGFDWIV